MLKTPSPLGEGGYGIKKNGIPQRINRFDKIVKKSDRTHSFQDTKVAFSIVLSIVFCQFFDIFN